MPILINPTVNPETTVTFEEIILYDAEDPADAVSFVRLGETYKVEQQIGGGVDHDYASGRSRAWSDESDVTGISLPLRWVSADQMDWLRAHRGRTVCFRDHLGRKEFCVYHSLSVDVDPSADSIAHHDVALSLTSVTFSEAV